MKIVLATNNQHKITELNHLLADAFPDTSIEILSLNDFPAIPETEETGKTFSENALLKAETIFKKLKLPVIADDSGIEVSALNNRPGVLSKRYAGPSASDQDRIKKLLKELKGVPWIKRDARFVCSMVLLDRSKKFITNGYCHGYIAERAKGKNGFGYDPVFFLPDMNKTMAQLSLKQKNILSHRANALKKIINIIREHYEI